MHYFTFTIARYGAPLLNYAMCVCVNVVTCIFMSTNRKRFIFIILRRLYCVNIKYGSIIYTIKG